MQLGEQALARHPAGEGVEEEHRDGREDQVVDDALDQRHPLERRQLVVLGRRPSAPPAGRRPSRARSPRSAPARSPAPAAAGAGSRGRCRPPRRPSAPGRRPPCAGHARGTASRCASPAGRPSPGPALRRAARRSRSPSCDRSVDPPRDDGRVLRRRTLLAAGLGSGAMLAVGCGRRRGRRRWRLTGERVTYGDDPSRSTSSCGGRTCDSRGVVVVIHGGFWKAEYDRGPRPPARRRPRAARMDDAQHRVPPGRERRWRPRARSTTVAAAIDTLRTVDGLDLSTVVTLGHSAGGHLATWAAARRALRAVGRRRRRYTR